MNRIYGFCLIIFFVSVRQHKFQILSGSCGHCGSEKSIMLLLKFKCNIGEQTTQEQEGASQKT